MFVLFVALALSEVTDTLHCNLTVKAPGGQLKVERNLEFAVVREPFPIGPYQQQRGFVDTDLELADGTTATVQLQYATAIVNGQPRQSSCYLGTYCWGEGEERGPGRIQCSYRNCTIGTDPGKEDWQNTILDGTTNEPKLNSSLLGAFYLENPVSMSRFSFDCGR